MGEGAGYLSIQRPHFLVGSLLKATSQWWLESEADTSRAKNVTITGQAYFYKH